MEPEGILMDTDLMSPQITISFEQFSAFITEEPQHNLIDIDCMSPAITFLFESFTTFPQ